MRFYVQKSQYNAAIKYINANNEFCKSESQAKEALDDLIASVIKDSHRHAVMTAQTLGILAYRVSSSYHVQIFVTPDLYDSTHGHNPTLHDANYAIEVGNDDY